MYPKNLNLIGIVQAKLQFLGDHPEFHDGVVDRTACMTGLHSGCDETYDIKIMKCDGFYAYYLPATDGCHSYCVGEW